jgi:hypothetical protein
MLFNSKAEKEQEVVHGRDKVSECEREHVVKFVIEREIE